MSPLLETIKCANGKLYNLEWHNSRFNHSRKTYFGIRDALDLSEIIKIPKHAKSGLFRCRVTYSTRIEKIEFLPHIYRKIERLKLVEDNSIDYRFKYADRTHLQKLFVKRGDCDDILIVKNGCITDSFTANPVFFDGEKWWTPDTPLLPGTQRARLLKDQQIFECWIAPKDIIKYEKVGLINALQDLSNMPLITIKSIQF
jgi:4-amino-4-deoxychorismate lyase